MNSLVQVAYLLTAVAFILGVMRLRAPARARSGNLLAAGGMLLALVATAAVLPAHHLWWVGAALVVGGIAGTASARRVPMTAMPQMVALFNGMGGGAAALVAADETARYLPAFPPAAAAAPALFTVLIGSISFAGSMVAFAKLQELIRGRPITFPGQKPVNLLLLLLLIGVALLLPFDPAARAALLIGFAAGALLLGVSTVLPVGGADMPVIISLLNACTGLAAATTGFVLGNNVLIVAGALVGASGTILTVLMSRAMNRSLANVLFGSFGKLHATHLEQAGTEGEGVRATTVEDVAALLAYAGKVAIVPGYGLAVSRAQQEVRDLMDALLARGVDVRFGIHPVAGRMPGHMNVLLAEANVPYDRLYDMESINPDFPRTDVVRVIGANDVTNPAARNNPDSPLYGMPVLNVDQARSVVVLKRSLRPGFAGIDNDLYRNPKTMMLFGDARESLQHLLSALKDVA